MADKRTRFLIQAEAKGFESAKRHIKDFVSPLQKGLKESNKEMEASTKAIDGMDKGFKAFGDGVKDRGRQVVDTLRSVKQEARETEAVLDSMGRKRDARGRFIGGGGGGGSGGGGFGGGGHGVRGGFGAGVLTGAGMGEVFPQQGFGANVAGRMVGGGVRRAAGLGMAGFSGVGGLASSLGGIPVVGGFLSGQLQNLMSTAGAGLEVAGARQSLLPYLGTAGLGSEIQTAREAAAAANPIRQMNERAVRRAGARAGLKNGPDLAVERLNAFARTVGEAGLGENLSNQRMIRDAVPYKARGYELIAADEGLKKSAARMVTEARDQAIAQGETAERQRQQKLIDESKADRKTAIANAGSGVIRSKTGRFEDIALGRRGYTGMGVSQLDALQFAGGLSGAAGGGLGDISSDFYRSALGARQLGVADQNVSGAFLRQQRLGNSSNANSAMTRQIEAGMRLGLQGSDLSRYMQTTAQILQGFDQTGMAVKPESFARAAGSLAGGVGGERANVMGAQLVQAGQRLGTAGPQSGIDLMAMQDLFGYEGGGIKGYAKAQRDAAAGRFKKGGMKRFLGRITQGGSADEGQLRISRAFQSLGIQIGPQEAFQLAGGDPDAIARIKTRLTAANSAADDFVEAGGAAGVAEASRNRTLSRQNDLQAQKSGVGETMAPVAQSFEAGQIAATAEFAKLAPEINSAAKALGSFAKGAAKQITDTVKDIQDLVEDVRENGIMGVKP